MKRIKLKNNQKWIIYTIFILCAVLLISGLSYAYFVATANSNEQVVTSGVLELTYETGQNIQLENTRPTTEEGAGLHKFTISNTGTLNTEYNLYLSNISLTKNGESTTSDNLKYKLYESNSDYTTEGNLIQSGSFGANSGYTRGDTTLQLRQNVSIPSKEQHSYILKVWLEETGSLQNEDQGLSLSFTVTASTENTNNQGIHRTIYTLGDNIASGYILSSTSEQINYTTMLGEDLKQINCYDGAYSEGYEVSIDVFLQALKDTTLPFRNNLTLLRNNDVATFSLGTYDLIMAYEKGVQSGISNYDELKTYILQEINRVIEVYKQFLTEVSTFYQGHIILISPPNTAINTYADWGEQATTFWDPLFNTYDQKIQQLAEEFQVDYVSGYQLFKGKETIYIQLIEELGKDHITKEGYQLIKEEIKKIINTYTDNQILDTQVIVSMGDSIGAGVLAGGTTSSYNLGYNQMLYETLKQENPNLEILYGAVSGETTPGYLEYLASNKFVSIDLLDRLNEDDIITSSLTGNDIAAKIILNGKLTDFLINKTVTKEEIQQIIDTIISDYDIFLSTIREKYDGHFISLGIYDLLVPYLGLTDDTLSELAPWLEIMEYYDQKMQETSSKYHVDYISGYQLFKGKERTYFPTDGDVHPNEAGYRLIADEMLKIIRNYE